MTISTLVVTLAILTAPQATAAELSVQTLDGQTQTGTLGAWTETQLELVVGGKKTDLTWEQVLSVSGKAPRDLIAPTVLLELLDESVVPLTSILTADKTATCALAGETEPRSMPLARIRSVRFDHFGSTLTKAWDEIAEHRAAADVLVIRKGEALDYLEGAIGEINDQIVKFTLDGETLEVRRAKVYGMIFYRPESKDAASPRCRVTAPDGLSVNAKEIEYQNGTLAMTTTGGVEVARKLTQIARIDFSQGKLAYLADMEPSRLSWEWTFAAPGPLEQAMKQFTRPRANESFDSGPLQLGGKSYAKGLAARTQTRWEYRLAGKYRRMLALAGLDDRASGRGNVKLRVLGDDRELFTTEIAGRQKPVPLDLDVSDVRLLTIQVEFGSHDSVGDLFDLCEPRVLE